MKESFHIICGEKWCVGVRYIIPWCVVFVNVYFLHEFGSRADIQQDMVLLMKSSNIYMLWQIIVVVFSKVCWLLYYCFHRDIGDVVCLPFHRM